MKALLILSLSFILLAVFVSAGATVLWVDVGIADNEVEQGDPALFTAHTFLGPGVDPFVDDVNLRFQYKEKGNPEVTKCFFKTDATLISDCPTLNVSYGGAVSNETGTLVSYFIVLDTTTLERTDYRATFMARSVAHGEWELSQPPTVFSIE